MIMPTGRFRFYAELNDFLPYYRRQVPFDHIFAEHSTVKDTIEALGVPHTEVDLILVNDVSVGFEVQIKDGDRVSVYPVFESLDIAPLVRLRPYPLREPKFVLDTHLGRLAAYLRLLGFDTLYRNDYADEELACTSVEEKRILLTRDRGLLKRRMVTHGYCVRSSNPHRQVGEILARFDLAGAVRPFARCLRCNGLLEPVAKEAVSDRVPPAAWAAHQEFHRCRSCDRIYWSGSHYAALQGLIAEALGASVDQRTSQY